MASELKLLNGLQEWLLVHAYDFSSFLILDTTEGTHVTVQVNGESRQMKREDVQSLEQSDLIFIENDEENHNGRYIMCDQKYPLLGEERDMRRR